MKYLSNLMNVRDLGVFLYNSKVYSPEEDMNGKRTYKIILKATKNGKITVDQMLGEEEIIYEDIQFIATLDLQDYTKTIKRRKSFKNPEKEDVKILDYEKIVNEFGSDLEEIEKRLDRRMAKKPKEQVLFNCYMGKREFLEFNDTAYSWGGPFSNNINDKEVLGCAVSLNHKNEYFVRIDDEENNFLNKVNNYHVYGDRSGIERLLSEKEPEEKKEIIGKLSGKQLLETYKKTMFFDREEMLAFYEYHIYLAGNDDCSYTKGFHTEEEVKEELEYLRMMQPLDFYIDIQGRDYIFTN